MSEPHPTIIPLPSIIIRNVVYRYTDSEFKIGGFAFDSDIDDQAHQPLEYWKAQLSFRGYSPRGSNLNALKQRLREADMTEMDPFVQEKLQEMKRQIEGPRKRKASDLGDSGRSAPSTRPDPSLAAGTSSRLVQSGSSTRPGPSTRPGTSSRLVQSGFSMRSGPSSSAGPSIPTVYGLPAPNPSIRQSNVVALSQEQFQQQFRALQQIQPRLPQTERIVDRNLAGRYPQAFLQKYFFDDVGQDTSAEPIELDGLMPNQLNEVHNHAASMGLFHRTADGNILVIGSKKNNWGQLRLVELNLPPVSAYDMGGRQSRPLYSAYSTLSWMRSTNSNTRAYENAGWTTIPTEPGISQINLAADRSAATTGLNNLRRVLEEIHQELQQHTPPPHQQPRHQPNPPLRQRANHSFDQMMRDTYQEVQAEFARARRPRHNRDLEESEDEERDRRRRLQEWDINGKWEIQCPEIENEQGHSKDEHGRPIPYTLEIFTCYLGGKAIYGRFELGAHTGVFRFTKSGPNAAFRGWGSEYELYEDVEPSSRDPMWCYRWRGRTNREEGRIIELLADKRVFTMTFSDHGKAVLGTWGGEDIGFFEFTGKKIDDGFDMIGMDIKIEWENVSRAAAGKEATARKRGLPMPAKARNIMDVWNGAQ